MDYIEEYRVAGLRLGIEDYESPGNHFFSNREHKRFKCWVIGCGICCGHDAIEEAREHIRTYAIERLTNEKVELQARLSICQDAVALLENDPLSSFRIRADRG